MSVHAIKPKVVERPIQREALRKAQEEAAAERSKLAALEAAVGKAVALVDQREQEVEKARANIEKARTADAKSAAEGLKKNSTPACFSFPSVGGLERSDGIRTAA